MVCFGVEQLTCMTFLAHMYSDGIPHHTVCSVDAFKYLVG